MTKLTYNYEPNAGDVYLLNAYKELNNTCTEISDGLIWDVQNKRTKLILLYKLYPTLHSLEVSLVSKGLKEVDVNINKYGEGHNLQVQLNLNKLYSSKYNQDIE